MISIIIPVYNVRDYILRCLESVAAQTYDGAMECLIIDDCGQDDSIAIVEQFIADYKGDIDFRIIHHEHNRGLSAARNTGIHEAKGEWLYFLDSDDWIVPECIGLMAECVKREPDLEMVMGDIKQIGNAYPWPDFYLPDIKPEDIIGLACSYKIYTMAWNKLLLRDFILQNKLYFVEGLYHEDVLWNFELACKLKKMASIPQKTYNYLVREHSIQTDKSYKFHFIHNTKVKVEMIRYIFKNNLAANETIYKYVTSDIYENIYNLWNRGERILSRYYYKKLRSVPYWPLKFVINHSRGKLEKVLALHRYVPVSMGVNYILAVNKVYGFMKRVK